MYVCMCLCRYRRTHVLIYAGMAHCYRMCTSMNKGVYTYLPNYVRICTCVCTLRLEKCGIEACRCLIKGCNSTYKPILLSWYVDTWIFSLPISFLCLRGIYGKCNIIFWDFQLCSSDPWKVVFFPPDPNPKRLLFAAASSSSPFCKMIPWKQNQIRPWMNSTDIVALDGASNDQDPKLLLASMHT